MTKYIEINYFLNSSISSKYLGIFSPSLLAQVDSSIGGKTGVDFRAYKNMVGAFHQPKLVYSCAETLKTLTEQQYISGLGEIPRLRQAGSSPASS